MPTLDAGETFQNLLVAGIREGRHCVCVLCWIELALYSETVNIRQRIRDNGLFSLCDLSVFGKSCFPYPPHTFQVVGCANGLGKSLTQILSPQINSVNPKVQTLTKEKQKCCLNLKYLAYYMHPFFERTIAGAQIKMTSSMGHRLHTPVLFSNSLLICLIVLLLTLLYHHL